jgi:hypothetical protein
MLPEELRDVGARSSNEAPNLFVDDSLGLFGVARREERLTAVSWDDRDRADRVAHPTAPHHVTRDHGQLLAVGLGAGRLLGNTTSSATRPPSATLILPFSSYSRSEYRSRVWRRERNAESGPRGIERSARARR